MCVKKYFLPPALLLLVFFSVVLAQAPHQEQTIAPKSVKELSEAIKNHEGPIAFVGSGASQGGQTNTPAPGLRIYMGNLNKVVAFSTDKKEITVQGGMTWKELIKILDREGLAVLTMQSFSSFTVGASVAVGAHGRTGESIVSSVQSIKIVLASGEVVTASRTENPELFYNAFGSHGVLGAIVEVTLKLTDNVPLKQIVQKMSVNQIPEFFKKYVKDNPNVVFFNYDIYGLDNTNGLAILWVKTKEPLTIRERIASDDPADYKDKIAYIDAISNPKVSQKRRKESREIVDAMRYNIRFGGRGGGAVALRNWAAADDIVSLGPDVGKKYFLTEFFVPADEYQKFVDKMTNILRDRNANVFNISVRSSKAWPESLMSWAPKGDVFSFVLYYRQEPTPAAKKAVGVWMREVIDAELAVGGTFYRVYQPHATVEQFREGYPNTDAFIELRKKYDPMKKFENKESDKYLSELQVLNNLQDPNREQKSLEGLLKVDVSKPALLTPFRWR